MATVLITGGTGLIGRALTEVLVSKGYAVIILTRDVSKAKDEKVKNLSYAAWNVSAQTIDNDAVQQADYIVHLAGAGVAEKRWTEKRKKEIVDSRTQSSALIVKALRENNNKVKAVISSSAIGWYGPDPAIPNTKPFVETDKADNAFLGTTCRQWEESINETEQLGKRLVKLRTGIVLSNEGGAFTEFKKSLRFGVAAILGNGNQVISWIHIDDICRIFLKAIEEEAMNGVYNAVAPNPVSNKGLMLRLAKEIRGKFYIPIHVPAFILKWILGEMSIEVLKSATVSADKIHKTGFQFLYPTIDAALNQLTGKKEK